MSTMPKTKPEPDMPLKGLSDSGNLKFVQESTDCSEKLNIFGVPAEKNDAKKKWNERPAKVIKNMKGFLTNCAHADKYQSIADEMEFTAASGSCLTLDAFKYVVGLGDVKPESGLSRKGVADFAQKVIELTKRSKRDVRVIASEDTKIDINIFVASLRIASWERDSYKTVKAEDQFGKTIYLIGFAGELDMKEADKVAEAVVLATELTEAPPSHCHPQSFAKVAKEAADKRPTVSYECFDFEQCRDMGMNSFCGVSQGMKNQPAFIHLSYKNGTPKHRMALVGKGVCHDTGGYNIKSFASGIHDMHTDMGGAAVTLASFFLMVDSAPVDVEFDAIIPCVENLIDSNAYLPGDIITAMNGMSICVVNTDAEGRLILNDGICYAQKLFEDREEAQKNTEVPKTIISSATLTGAQVVALAHCSAFYSTKKEYANIVTEATEQCWEEAWNMPFLESLNKNLDHPRADTSNLGNPPGAGGSITAALFLKKFVTMENVDYMHFDIAGAVYEGGKAKGYGPELYRKFLTKIMEN